MRVANHKLNRSGAAQPISQHPLFPAIVALWFGALFGVASLALPPALVERLVMATGIDKVVPMTAPPLGATARTLISLGLTGLGALIGALAARRLARPAKQKLHIENATNFEADDEAAPIEAFATEAARPALPGRRRSLLVQEGTPAAGKPEPQILDVADLDLAHFDALDEDAAAIDLGMLRK